MDRNRRGGGNPMFIEFLIRLVRTFLRIEDDGGMTFCRGVMNQEQEEGLREREVGGPGKIRLNLAEEG